MQIFVDCKIVCMYSSETTLGPSEGLWPFLVVDTFTEFMHFLGTRMTTNLLFLEIICFIVFLKGIFIS